jgi:hypothetical protein
MNCFRNSRKNIIMTYMNTKGIIIFLAIPLLTVTSLLFINNAAFLGGVEQSRINEIRQQQDAGSGPSSGNTQLPTDEEFVQLFFQTLETKNTAVSLGMLDPSNLINGDTAKEWEKQLASFEKAQVTGIEPYNQAKWTSTEHAYKTTVNVQMLPEAAKATIPNYGWQNGDNIRWITVRKGTDSLWRVVTIATGP